jgi:hypothetical protein
MPPDQARTRSPATTIRSTCRFGLVSTSCSPTRSRNQSNSSPRPKRILRRTSPKRSPVGYRLVVQAKLRSGDAWTVAGINALLKHGGVNRLSAARRLAAPDVRYLLITSAGLNGETRGLRVARAGSWPKPTGMPTSTMTKLPARAAGRIGIIANMDEDKLVPTLVGSNASKNCEKKPECACGGSAGAIGGATSSRT